MMKSSKFLAASVLILCACILGGCPSGKSSEETKLSAENIEVTAEATSPGSYDLTEDKSSLAEYYELEHIKEWYPERILPPPFDFNVDLTNKSVVELWLLRNEIFARNGYLFDDAVLRGHFNQFKWYQPIFEVPEFQVQLNRQEQDFIDKVLKHENELAKSRYAKQGAYEMIDLDHVYNLMQFKSIGNNLTDKLRQNNFAVVPAQNEQLFHVYDRNHYEYIPNFITTDIYLQVLHKHFSTLLQKIEEDKFIPLMTDLLADLHQQSRDFVKASGDARLQNASQWSATYLGIAHSLITGTIQAPGNEIVKTEVERILSAQGVGSEFLKFDLIQYSQFKPRGNYTKSKELENYFRCVKWLNTAPILIEDDERLLSATLIASFIKKRGENLKSFQRFNDAIKFIVGEEDNLSIGNLVTVLSASDANNLTALNDPGKLNRIRKDLVGLTVDRIKPKGGDAPTGEKLAQKSILFTAGRYTFDAEILSRLIHVLRPEPKRPFPKGLDVFASLGNKDAESILMNEYGEHKKWTAFPDSLNKLKAKFSKFDEWDKNIYSKTFEAIVNLDYKHVDLPLFMQTSAWGKKNLNTSLAAWTELKHDMLLYAEQPYAAQAGEGGGPPPPTHVSFVEPNIRFWENSLELLDFQEEQLTKMDLLNTATHEIIRDLQQIATFLLAVSKKELAHEPLTREQFNELSYLGGRIEYLTYRIFDSDHLPAKERLVAVVADVYNYNGNYLEEAVGMVDEIYAIAEINGKPYLTKGAIFSYYEFTSESPLTDEEWRARLTTGKAPERPVWMNEIVVISPSLESKAGYSF